jgi:uncharacterized membrane protein
MFLAVVLTFFIVVFVLSLCGMIAKQPASENSLRAVFFSGVGAVILVWMFYLCGGSDKKVERADSTAELNEIKRERVAREHVSASLKDAASAQFRGQHGFCGEVNSKNSFGAFTGFQRFVVIGDGQVALERDSGVKSADFFRMWTALCK